MGLLNYITGHGLDKPRGLLARAIDLAQAGKGDFASVCIALGARHAAVLANRMGTFRAVHAFALDAETLVSSVSSADWWHGIMGNSDARTFSKADGTLAGCYQLLSAPLRDGVTRIDAVSISSDEVFVCVTLDGEDGTNMASPNIVKRAINTFIEKAKEKSVYIPSHDESLYIRFEEALKASSAVLCRLETREAVEKCLAPLVLKDDAGGIVCDVREALYEQLIQILSRAFPPPTFCLDGEDGAVKLAVFVNEGFDKEVALFHIQKRLECVLGKESREVVLSDAARATNADEIMSFIKKIASDHRG